ncbi:hypothetical protein EYR40_009159 [Pleurotus pulmonarius]|nr:hypothetical protein EYR40_009159 [Pleurotus pulmonarius]
MTALLPEILKRIFELSTDSANRSNALVCKGWCEEALSVVWSDVDAHRLFALLAPMKLEDCERYFSRDLEDGDWDRFEVYSWRVRSLRFATHSHVRALRSLKIQSPNESGADYLPLTNFIGSLCTSLESLELARAGVASAENAIPADKRCGIESLTNLTSLSLRAFDAPSPLEFERLLEPLPKLESPSISGGLRKTPLYSLAVISRRCKDLTVLELELDVDTTPRPVHAPPAPFPFLQRLGMQRSAAQTTPRVLCIPELLQRIFQLCPDEANTTNACVCKAWNEEATRVIWRDVPAGRLFSLLAALVSHLGEDGKTYFSFSRAITEVDWDRFDRYSSKVYSLRFTQRYDPSVFKEIAVGRRRLDFLPNLTTLYNARPTALFAYPRLKHFIIREESFTSKEVIEWLTLIEHRMPYIERLYINPESLPSPDVLPAFTSTLRRATFLKELDVPAGYLNNSNFPILASMPKLQRICSYHRSWPATNFNARSLFELPGDPFRSLQEFSANLDFNTATAYVPELNCFQGLRVLKIASHARESPEAYIALIDVIAQHCPGLTVLSLERRSAVLSSDEYDLAYGHHVQNMLKSLRHLESLTLRRFGVRGRMPLRDFALFAPHSKALKLLRIDIDSGLISSEPPYPFSALKRLHYESYSTLRTDPKEVACFLSRILPPNCKITSNEISNPELYESFQVVITWVPILIKARMEGRRAAVWDQLSV